MTDINKVPTYKTLGKLTAAQLIKNAEIIETLSGDYYYRYGNYDMCLTDDYELAVSDFGITLCVMDLDSDLQDKMIAIETQIEEKYEIRQLMREL